MGIPSYYKKLADHIQGLVRKSYDGKASALYFDFNCLIYYVARKPNSTLPPYPGYDKGQEWEALLLEDIVKYVVKVWQLAGQPSEVFLAIDGVVPMAKIKQQRLRRFKSVWLTEEEKKEGIRENKASWDTNCITPGTSFMKRLTRRLQTLCSKHAHWSVSGADEPGEGEHKVMAKLRQRDADTDPVLVYGLDADLILLTMLNSKSPAYLVRETSEMGVVQLNSMGDEELSYFSLDALKQTIPPGVDLPSYVAGMSLLGNDFLPHSLTIKMREDGHQVLTKSLINLQLVIEKDGLLMINHDDLYSIVKEWAKDEDRRALVTFKKKLQMRGRVQRCLDTKPLDWMVEDGLIYKQGDQWMIRSEWRDRYQTNWLQCDRRADVMKICKEYLYGLQWVLDYYTGQRPVNLQWSFSRLVPPLWSDLQECLERGETGDIQIPWSEPIQPHEQLAMVLPFESWHFIEDPSLRSLPSRLPQFWPTSFEFFSAGRIHMWECEPLLPILPVQRIRDVSVSVSVLR